MKRSEMIKILAEAMNDNFNGCDDLENWEFIAPNILDKLEEVGMLPPERKDYSKFKNADGYSNSWDEE